MREQAVLSAEGVRLLGRKAPPIDFAVHAGDRIGLLGARGSGKRALLRTLARLERPAAGRVLWGSADVTRRPLWLIPGVRRGDVVLIWANPYVLFRDEVPVRRLLGPSGTSVSEPIAAWLVRVGLSPAVLDFRVGALSGLERVRLAMAYAGQHRPRVLLVDDVFEHLVPESWAGVLSTLEHIVDKDQALVVASQHCDALCSLETLVVMAEAKS